MVRVKICGITRKEDALVALEAGAHALGLVFYPESPRYVDPEYARWLVPSLPPLVSWVGVFVNRSVEEMVVTARGVGLDTLQLHGDEEPRVCRACLVEGFKVIKAIRVASEKDLEWLDRYRGSVSAILLDTRVPGRYGGTGQTFHWRLAAKVGDVPVILAGGLTPDNVTQAIEEVHPWGVDVSSGVERTPGVKDHRLVELFVRRAIGLEVRSKR